MTPITDMARYKAERQKPVTDFFRWHEAMQELVMSLLRIQFHAHRDFIRFLVR